VILTLTHRHNIALSEPAPAGTAASPLTQIFVQGVPIDIPSGTELRFSAQDSDGCTGYRLRTNGITTAGADRISIQPYIGRLIPCHWIADCGPVDLTSRTYKAQVKKKLSDVQPYLTLQCTTIPLEGILKIKCTTTGAEDTNATFKDLPSSDDDLQAIEAVKRDSSGAVSLAFPQYKKIIEAAWYWDLEYTFRGETIPDYAGLFWLHAEATVQP